MQEISLVLIGHKDHGKSTLIGRLLLDTNSIKENRLKEIKESDRMLGKEFELAHLVDSFKEERENEMTLDTTRILLQGQKRNYQLIDVPGHAELISNMLTGASAAEAALLVVSIEEGIKEQTKQHLEIAKILGIEQIGIAINKMDTVGYQKGKFEEVKEKAKEILNQIGFLSGNVSFFPISAKEGVNVIKKSEKIKWYQGETLMEFLEDKIIKFRPSKDFPLILPIQDRYLERGREILIGKIENGRIGEKEEILILPDNRRSRVMAIRDTESKVKEGILGQNVGVILEEHLRIGRGSVITSLETTLKVSDNLSGKIFWIERPSQKNLILECGTARVKGRLQKPEIIDQRKTTHYQILLERKITIYPKSKTILGKIVLKDKGKIIAVGNVL